MVGHEFPYSNLHDLNIDWILKIVKDFQTKYDHVDEVFQTTLQQIEEAGEAAIQAITENKDNALESIGVFLQQCIQAIDTKTNEDVQTLNETGNTQNQRLIDTGNSARNYVANEGILQTNRITNLIATLPDTYEDSLNQLQIINATLNGTYNYPPLVQGHYADSQAADSKILVSDNYRVSTLISTGCASKRIRIQITDVNSIIRDIIYWTGWGDSAIAHEVPVSTGSGLNQEKTLYTYTFPSNATYFTIVFAYDYNMTRTLAVEDVKVTLQWLFNQLEEITINEHGFDSTNTNAIEFVVPGNTNLTIEEGEEIDEIDVSGGTKTVATSHKLKDSDARISVNELKSALNSVESDIYDMPSLNDFTWEYGNINNTNGKDSATGADDHTRVRTSNWIKLAKDAVITLNSSAPSTYRIYIVRYSEPIATTASFIETSVVIRTTAPTYTNPSDCYIRMFAFYSNGTAFASEDELMNYLSLSGNMFLKLVPDNTFSSVSENAVQNKVITNRLLQIERELQEKTFPSYYDAEIDAVITEVKAKNLLSAYGDSFIFSTDLHYRDITQVANTDNEGHTIDLAKYVALNTNNKLFICGGDILSENHTKSEALNLLWRFACNASKAFGDDFRILFGNHDDNHTQSDASTSESRTLSENELYATLVKAYENAVISNDKLHYYWDNPNQKIRYVALNTGTGVNMNYDSQYAWLDNVIKGVSEGYRIVILAHGVFTSYTDATTYTISTGLTNMLNMCDAYNMHTSVTIGNVTYDYSNIANRAIVAVLCGHVHKDGGIYYGSSSIPVIVTAMDAFSVNGNQAGTVNEHTIDFVNLDFTNEKIYLTRLGRNGNTTRTREFNIVSL